MRAIDKSLIDRAYSLHVKALNSFLEENAEMVITKRGTEIPTTKEDVLNKIEALLAEEQIHHLEFFFQEVCSNTRNTSRSISKELIENVSIELRKISIIKNEENVCDITNVNKKSILDLIRKKSRYLVKYVEWESSINSWLKVNCAYLPGDIDLKFIIGASYDQLINILKGIAKVQTEEEFEYDKETSADELESIINSISFSPDIYLLKDFYKLFSAQDNKLKWTKNCEDYTYEGVDFLNNLGIRICPYCNRTFILNTVVKMGLQEEATEGTTHIRHAQIDHIFPKSKVPLFALSFFNLIPICQSCNFIKSNKILSYNPYKQRKDEPIFTLLATSEFQPKMFELKLSEAKKYFKLTMPTEGELGDLFSKICLKGTYENHVVEAVETMWTIQKYPNSLLEEHIRLSFSGENLNDGTMNMMIMQMKDSIYGIDSFSLNVRKPLDKLKKDIIKQFERT